MNHDFSRCACGAKFIPTANRTDRCRVCARTSRAFGQVVIDDEFEGVPAYLPTPEQIAAEYAAIRAGWDRHRWRLESRRAEPLTVREVAAPRLE